MRVELPDCVPATHNSVLITHHFLLVPISNPAAGKIIRRHFNADAIAYKNANSVLAHLARHSREHHVLGVVELYFEKCIGLFVDNGALRRNQIVSSQISSP